MPTATPFLFPPRPVGLKGRQSELAALQAVILGPPAASPVRLALVGGGGSGKSMLACALGHRVRRHFRGGVHWFRSGPWDARTLAEMLAIRFGSRRGSSRRGLFASLRDALAGSPPRLIVLDNHENDVAAVELLNELAAAPIAWVLTARRCLVAGVTVFPVIAPQATTGRVAFPRVHALATTLRRSPLALDIADALVGSGAIDVRPLRDWLVDHGVRDLRVIDHEDDLPEVALLLAWAWERLRSDEKRVLAVLAASAGDHIDAASLAALARVGDPAPGAYGHGAFARLRAWHLVQEPLAGRYALHAVVRHAVSKRTRFAERRFIEHYIPMLERAPERLDLEQTHLYAAMDFAHSGSSLDWMLRIERLLARLAELASGPPRAGLSAPKRDAILRGRRA